MPLPIEPRYLEYGKRSALFKQSNTKTAADVIGLSQCNLRPAIAIRTLLSGHWTEQDELCSNISLPNKKLYLERT